MSQPDQTGSTPVPPGQPGAADGPPLPPPGPPPAPGQRLSRRAIVIFSGLAAAGLVVGVGAAKLTGGSGQTEALRPSQIVATAPVVTPTVSTPAPSITVTTAKPAPSPKKTTYPPPDYSVIPADATTADDLDFGFLTGVQKNGDLVTLSFDRAVFYTGKEAIEHNHGKAPADDYLIENTNPMVRTFTLAAKAPIIGTSRLVPGSAGSVKQQQLTAQAFVQNATAALQDGEGIPVWLRHAEGGNGPVTSLAEQFVP